MRVELSEHLKLKEHYAELEAQCAAYRRALEFIAEDHLYEGSRPVAKNGYACRDRAREALTSQTAGQELLAELSALRELKTAIESAVKFLPDFGFMVPNPKKDIQEALRKSGETRAGV